MQASAPKFAYRLGLGRFALITLAGCALAACDKHSAAKVPESYGHGSARQKSYTDHAVDSSGPKHYSDTQGTVLAREDEKSPVQHAPNPAGTPGGHFF